MIGKTVSHYKILEKLGEGGMGVVYKAEDTNLKRKVALKFLPPELTRDPEAKERFIREAQSASALDHPNIGTIHEIDQTDEGHLFIAMACYEGETLKQKIERGPVRIAEVIDLSIQVAEGLTNAHERGIIHRDIKPANIMLDPDGRVKILDFGLAKLQGQTQLTKAGMALGTTAYMSPEQLRGGTVDHRTDIWSLGVMIYEMVTGQPPFRGDYEQSVSYSILNEHPEPLTGLRTGVPMELERIVTKTIAKDPNERYQHIDELPVDLKAVKDESGGVPEASAAAVAPVDTQRPVKRRNALLWALIGLIIGATVTGFAVRSLFRFSPQVTRLAVSLPKDHQLVAGSFHPLAISPDGKHLVYGAKSGSRNQLYMRNLDRYEARPIPGTENAQAPFFSPDGQWVAFFADGKLQKVSLAGGAPTALCNASVHLGGSWGEDDSIVFSAGLGSGLMRVPSSGGSPERLTTPDFIDGENTHAFPQILPDDRGVLFSTRKEEHWCVSVLSLETLEWQVLHRGGRGGEAQYLPTGHLVYTQSDNFLAVPFDLKRFRINGSPISILDGVSSGMTAGMDHACFAISKTGLLAYVPGRKADTDNTLVLVDRRGGVTPLTSEKANYGRPQLSPDGKLLAVDIGTDAGGCDVWIYDVERGTRSRLTTGGINIRPVWTPDGKHLAFASRKSGPMNIYWNSVDGSEEAQPLLTKENHQFPASWSPDSQALAYIEVNPKTGLDIWVLDVESDRTPVPVVVTSFNEGSSVFSPDGHWLAYVSDETGRHEVYVRPYPGSGEKRPISTDGGSKPRWSTDGRELFYRHGDMMMVVAIETEPAFTAGTPQPVFEDRYEVFAVHDADYDVSPDGNRFLMIGYGETSTPTRINIVLNWFEELKRLVPGEK